MFHPNSVLLIVVFFIFSTCSTHSISQSPSSSTIQQQSTIWDSLRNSRYSFVFLLPPTSFAYGQITLGLELYKRGHRIVFATLDGLQKHFDQQYHSLQINENEQRNLIEPEIISFGPLIEFGDKALLKLVSTDLANGLNNPAAEKKALMFYNALFERVIDGIEIRRNESDSSHPLYSSDSLFIVPGAFDIPVNYLRNRHQPFALIFPSPSASFMLSSPIFSPDPFILMPSFNKTLSQRLQCLFRSFTLNLIYGRVIAYANPWLDLRHVYSQPVLKLIPSIPSLTALKYYPPLTVFTGPMMNTARSNVELIDDERIQHVLNGPLPVIYISFGTYAEMSAPQIEFIVKSSLSKDKKWSVIWALKDHQKNEMSHKASRAIKSSDGLFSIVPWINTPSILNHHNTILFVSHCGGNGINEAVALGKPVIGIPLFGDQHANCFAGKENLQSVACFNFTQSKPREIYDLIDDIISNPQNHSMIVNAKKAQILSTSAYRGVETAANWLEAAAALKGDVRMLETPIEREGVIKSYCIDILVSFVLLVYIFGVLMGLLLEMRRRKRKPQSWKSWAQSWAAKKIPVIKLLDLSCQMRSSYMWFTKKFSFRKKREE